jgi:VWFA-related protein
MLKIPVFFALSAIAVFAQAPSPQPPPALPQDSQTAEPPAVTFRSDVSLVRVDARVVDGENRPIQALTKDDFVLRLNGKQQDIHEIVTEKMPVDLILLLDVSRSMQPHVERIASAAHEALNVLGDQDRIAIMVFDRATRVRMPFSSSRKEAETQLTNLVNDESFDGGTDITRGLLDAASYMASHGRRDARRAIVILTDDQTERDRDDAGVLRALERADCVLSALIAPDALHTGSAPMDTTDNSSIDDEFWKELKRRGLIPPGFTAPDFKVFGGNGSWGVLPHTQSAGTANIARKSGGDSMAVEDASAFHDTLARIRERYALYFYLPEGVQKADAGSIEVELSDAARQRYPDAQVQYRESRGGSEAHHDLKDWV